MILSIITVNLNNAEGLQKTIASIKSQKSLIEFIIVDGGSSDDSVKIIKEHSGIIDLAIIGQDNGIYDAMNIGLKKASGKYVLFLNSGDFLTDNGSFQKVLEILNTSNEAVFYGDVITTPDLILKPEPLCIEAHFWLDSNICHQAMFFPREILLLMGSYDTTFKIVADYCMNVKMYINGITFKRFDTDLPLVYYNIEGISSTNKECVLLERQRVKERFSSYFNLVERNLKLKHLEKVLNCNCISRGFWLLLKAVWRINWYIDNRKGFIIEKS